MRKIYNLVLADLEYSWTSGSRELQTKLCVQQGLHIDSPSIAQVHCKSPEITCLHPSNLLLSLFFSGFFFFFGFSLIFCHLILCKYWSLLSLCKLPWILQDFSVLSLQHPLIPSTIMSAVVWFFFFTTLAGLAILQNIYCGGFGRSTSLHFLVRWNCCKFTECS